jgi:hypothetical protein
MSREPDTSLIGLHLDAVEARHRFSGVKFRGLVEWDLSHLDAFAFRHDVSPNVTVDVVVLFSCHCFTHASEHDDRPSIPPNELYRDGHECRVLNEERYQLSQRFFPQLIKELGERHIRVAGDRRPNYLTVEAIDHQRHPRQYAVFFEVIKDSKRRKRLLLRVQTAYLVEQLPKRLQKARKVNLSVLLRAVHEGRAIKG